ncbi:hypothetical protein B0H34DRAFT_735652 [Crassisporium funariophilum]|nr:hypothetical protein B0H34DRAFT_735652 [Crassisporium funariophilum]
MDVILPIPYFSVRVMRFFMPQEKNISLHPVMPGLRYDGRDSHTQQIEYWARCLLIFHRSPASVSEWKVVQIQWYKEKLRVEHEYVVFTVQGKSPSDVLYLRFDRRALGDNETYMVWSAFRMITVLRMMISFSHQTLSGKQRKMVSKRRGIHFFLKCLRGVIGVSKALAGKGLGAEPDDTIKVSRHATGIDKYDSDESDLMVTYTNFRHSFPLRDLGIIAKTVVETGDGYALLVQQCYWLARTLVGISVAKYEPQPEQGIREDAFSRAGRLSRLPFLPDVNRDSPTEIATHLEQVKNAIENDDARVHAVYMAGEGGAKVAERSLATTLQEIKKDRARGAEDRARELEEQLQEERQERQKVEDRVRELVEQRHKAEDRARALEEQRAAAGDALATGSCNDPS